MIDNHLASQGQAEYEKRTDCPNCGKGELEDIEYCTNDNCECFNDRCPSYNDNFTCVMMERRLKCSNCGAIVEAQ